MGTYQKKSIKYHWTTILETLAGNFLGGCYNVEPSAGDTNEDIMVKEPRNEPLAFSGGSPEFHDRKHHFSKHQVGNQKIPC